MKPAVIAYLPGPSHGHAAEFMQNLEANPAGIPVHFYSDHSPYGVNPCQSPTVVYHPHAKFRVSNHAFLSGLKLAIEKGATTMLYAEEDSRVFGDHWGARLFDEFSTYPSAVVGGTPCCYNPSNNGHETLRRLTVFAYDYLIASGTPMTIHGYQPGIYFYPNGSLSILDVALMRECFAHLGFEHDISKAARINSAWDEVIGKFLFARYGNDIFDLFAPSVLSYSGCANAIYSEEDRMAMIQRGEKLAVHQIKGPWVPS